MSNPELLSKIDATIKSKHYMGPSQMSVEIAPDNKVAKEALLRVLERELELLHLAIKMNEDQGGLEAPRMAWLYVEEHSVYELLKWGLSVRISGQLLIEFAKEMKAASQS